MSTVQQELNSTTGMRNVAPAQHYSTIVKFIDEVAKNGSNSPPTSVDIFVSDGKWYCQVRRGDETVLLKVSASSAAGRECLPTADHLSKFLQQPVRIRLSPKEIL